MNIVQDGRRRLLLSIVAMATLVCGVVGISFLVRPRTAFERQHARAEAMNPPWLTVRITTRDNRREYREGEPIVVVPHFSSAARYKYRIDVAEGWSRATLFDTLHISDGQLRPLNPYAIVCCATHKIGLDDEPYSPPAGVLTLKPGDYELYLTSRRVFKWDAAPTYEQSSFEVASNLLKLRVVSASRTSHDK